MDFEMGENLTKLRRELRELVQTHVPEGFLGAFTDNPADFEAVQRFCRTLAERGLLCLSWPEEFGGRGGTVWDHTKHWRSTVSGNCLINGEGLTYSPC